MVNTFVVDDSPTVCAELLDPKRLGKQRVEARQIINTLENKEEQWSHHPAVKMWEDHVDALKYYFNCMVDEWVKRGYKNNLPKYELKEVPKMPWWFTCGQLQMSHIAALVRKNPEYYTGIFIITPAIDPYMKLGYVWPSKLTGEILSQAQLGKRVDPHLICAPMGSGIPPEYRYSKDIVEAWLANPSINPLTKRKITSTGNIYRDFVKAAKAYHMSNG